MHLWAKPVDGKWSVMRIELELNKNAHKRLVIKDGPKFENPDIQQSK